MKKISLVIFMLAFIFSSCKKKDKGIENADKLTPNNFLSSAKYTSLTVEVVYEQGFPPSPESLSEIQNFLNARLNKPSGIIISAREINTSVRNHISLSEILEIERKHRQYFPNGNTITAFVFLANSDYSGNSGNFKTLGIQYGGSSIVLFGKTMRSYSGGLAQPPYKTLETSVALHEFGHILGLVNTGTEMVTHHEGGPEGHHCNNKDCLMHYAVETTDIVANILGGNVPVLDANCLNDLKANGGK